MATTIDHLSVEYMIHVLQDFTDANGVEHKVGESGLITNLEFSQISHEIYITWLRDGNSETMMFRLTDKTGPGSGRMKQYFEKGDYMPAPPEGKKFVPNFGFVPIVPTLPEPTSKLIKNSDQLEDALDRVWALAGRNRFDEADEQLQTILNAPDRRGDNAQRAAEVLCGAAKLHIFDDDPTVYRWLREKGIGLWYAWGSGATSGGEGAARATEIRKAEKDFAEIDKKLGR